MLNWNWFKCPKDYNSKQETYWDIKHKITGENDPVWEWTTKEAKSNLPYAGMSQAGG